MDLVSTEGTPEEHAKARTMGSAYNAGYAQAVADIKKRLPEALEFHLTDLVGDSANWTHFAQVLISDALVE